MSPGRTPSSILSPPALSQAMLIVPSTTQADLAVPLADLPQPPSYAEVIYDPKEQPS